MFLCSACLSETAVGNDALVCFHPHPTTTSSLGKSQITVAWKPILAAAIQYSQKENQLKAIEGRSHKYVMAII